MTLQAPIILGLLRSLGDQLGPVPGGITLRVAGGSAGALAGLLRPSRVTADCDVVWQGEEDTWLALAEAGERVGAGMGLPSGWLSKDCTCHAWSWPLGWTTRCEPVGTFGAIDVVRLSRFDLIAAKVMGAPVRPQDLEDLRDIRPTPEELSSIEQHLDRLEAEDLDGRTFEDQRLIVSVLRGEA